MNTFKLLTVVVIIQLITNLIGLSDVQGQDPLRFKDAIEKFKPVSEVNLENLTVFAGSSTFTNWKHLNKSFPDKNVLNCGFGGSQTSDLIYFANEAIIRYNPVTVIIYEGDNDLASGKAPNKVIKDTHELISLIHSKLPKAKIVFITPKPSKRRWDAGFKDEFIEYNALLKKELKKYPYVKVVDIWGIMLDKNGMPAKEFYMDDNLHMTKAGYVPWARKLKKYVR